MNNMDFFLGGSIYIETSLKPSLCSTQDLGATGIILLSKKYFLNSLIEQTRLTRRHQSLWPCGCNPASLIIMNRRWQQSWIGVCNNHDSRLSFYNPTVFGNDKTGKFCIFKPVEYQMSISRPIFLKPALWKPTQMDYLFTIFLLQTNWLWSWSIDLDFLEGGNDKDLRMIRCRSTRILNPEHNLSNLFLCLFCSISLPWINPS